MQPETGTVSGVIRRWVSGLVFAEVEAEAAERARREVEGGEPAAAEADRATGEI